VFQDAYKLASLTLYYANANNPVSISSSAKFDTIEQAIEDIRIQKTNPGQGKFVIAVDNEDRENEGDLIIAGQDLTPDKCAFMIRYTRYV
jgi:3,4-dihydroxy-2-butanone 4-phosphate synthase